MPKLTIHSKEIRGANVLKVQVGTNCPQGGDAGHGGRTFFKLHDYGGTSMQCRLNRGEMLDVSNIEIVLAGDSECRTFTQALAFALEVLQPESDMFRLETTEENVK